MRCGYFKYGYNPLRTIGAVERTLFYCKLWLNDLDNIGHSHNQLYATYPLVLANICAKSGNNDQIHAKLYMLQSKHEWSRTDGGP